MFNLQPGQGIGFSASKQMAFGLGTAFDQIVEAVRRVASGGGQYVSRKAKLYKRIIREDAEMLETIIQSFIAGIFDD